MPPLVGVWLLAVAAVNGLLSSIGIVLYVIPVIFQLCFSLPAVRLCLHSCIATLHLNVRRCELHGDGLHVFQRFAR